MTDSRILIPDPGSGGGGSAQVYELTTNKLCPGHQAGILLVSGQTFEARSTKMLAAIDWGATVLGGSKCSLTFHAGKVTPNGARISEDLVDRSVSPIIQGALPGVTDYHEWLFPASIDAESTPGNVLVVLELDGLDVGATYTWEMKWGFLSGAKQHPTGTVPFRIAVDDLCMRAVVTAASGAGPKVLTIGTWQGWQSFPGYYENGSFGLVAPSGYEPLGDGKQWPITTVATPVAGSTLGAAFALQAAGRRFLVGAAADNKLHLINPITGAIIVSQAVAFAADPYDISFYPGVTPAKAVVATDDNNLRIMSVADGAISQDSAINVGVAGRACATNVYTGSSIAVWHGSRGVNPIRLRGYRVSDNAIINGASGISLEAAVGDVRRIHRITTGPNVETLLVATSRGKVHHVSADGLTILGTWTHPNGVVDLADIAASPNGVVCYVLDSNPGATELHYFWLPNTVGGPAYQHFDSSGLGGSTGLGLAVDANEDVLLTQTNNALTMLPGGGAFCRANPVTDPITGEHLRVAFIEA